MKKILQLTLIASFLLGVLTNCKKGEDDPFISLRTRKARVVGEWTLTSGKSTGSSVSHTGNNSNFYSQTLSASTLSYVDNSGSFTATFSFKVVFEKDGTFTITQTMSWNNGGTLNTSTNIISGIWNFTAGVGEYKNREQIYLKALSSSSTDQYGTNSQSSTSTYSGKGFGINGEDESWTIKELRNKKMVIYSNVKSSDNTSYDTEEFEMILEQ